MISWLTQEVITHIYTSLSWQITRKKLGLRGNESSVETFCGSETQDWMSTWRRNGISGAKHVSIFFCSALYLILFSLKWAILRERAVIFLTVSSSAIGRRGHAQILEDPKERSMNLGFLDRIEILMVLNTAFLWSILQRWRNRTGCWKHRRASRENTRPVPTGWLPCVMSPLRTRYWALLDPRLSLRLLTAPKSRRKKSFQKSPSLFEHCAAKDAD